MRAFALLPFVGIALSIATVTLSAVNLALLRKIRAQQSRLNEMICMGVIIDPGYFDGDRESAP